jgi:hypothetical protein
MWRAPNQCTAVKGIISPNATCRYYRRAATKTRRALDAAIDKTLK